MLKNSEKKSHYTALAELPVPVAASFASSTGDVIRVNFSKRDHERDLKRSFSRTIFVTGTNSVTSSLAQDASDVIATSFSPSKSRTAVLRQLTDGDKKRFVEVWQGDSLVVSRDVTATHGPFYTEDALISLSFSPSENLLIYTAEGLEPNTTKGDDQYDRFRYTPHFGEGFPGKKRPTLYLLRLQSSKEENEDEVPSNLSPLSFPQFAVPTLLGQAVFISEDRIIATGYEYMRSGRLLGLKGCLNRPTGVWQFDLSKSDNDLEKLSAISIQRLTPSSLSARSPRVLSRSTGQSKAIWIANTLGGAHASCSSIHSLDIATGKERTLVDIVWEPTQGGFPGLYTDFSLPSSPFLEIGSTNFLVTHSTWSSRFTVLLVNLETGEVKDLTPDQDDLLYSWTVLCTDGRNRIICVRSSFSIPPEVVLGSFDENLTISWQVLSKPTLNPELESLLKTIKATVIKIPDHHPVETVLVRTIQEVPDKLEGASASKPCVASPHGGPHANVGTFFTASYIALALEGYSVSLINYTGSVGYGETYVRKLLGKCGTLDVEDCIASVNHLIDIGQSTKGPGMQLIQGGSHGGFLAAHLIGQYPDVFGAAVIRNPVISCGEISTTDIPDWYFAEFGLPYDATSIVTPSIYTKLFDASPIAHVDKVRAKVLLLLGEVDLRVSTTNSLTFYHALKGRGKEVEMLAFPKDSHPLEGVETSRISWEAGRDWFALVRD